MEGDGLGFDFPLLDIDLVSAQNNGDILTNPNEIPCDNLSPAFTAWPASELTVPVRDVLVRDPRRYIEHDDSTLSVDVVSIP